MPKRLYRCWSGPKITAVVKATHWERACKTVRVYPEVAWFYDGQERIAEIPHAGRVEEIPIMPDDWRHDALDRRR